MQTISATELARKTREILDMVTGEGETVMVERNRTIVARISPPERLMTATQALAGLQSAMTRKQAASWLKQSREGFDEDLRDPWA